MDAIFFSAKHCVVKSADFRYLWRRTFQYFGSKMAGLNLVPNPTVIATQAAIFISAVYAVKKLYVEPYTKLREKRREATTGGKQSASDLLAENQSRLSELQEKLNETARRSQKIVEDAKAKAYQEKDAATRLAESESAEFLESFRKDMKRQLIDERAKLPKIIDGLSKAVFEKVVAR